MTTRWDISNLHWKILLRNRSFVRDFNMIQFHDKIIPISHLLSKEWGTNPTVMDGSICCRAFYDVPFSIELLSGQEKTGIKKCMSISLLSGSSCEMDMRRSFCPQAKWRKRCKDFLLVSDWSVCSTQLPCDRCSTKLLTEINQDAIYQFHIVCFGGLFILIYLGNCIE